MVDVRLTQGMSAVPLLGRIVQRLGLGGTFKGQLVEAACKEQGHPDKWMGLPRAPSNLTLPVSRDGARATCVGNLFRAVFQQPAGKGCLPCIWSGCTLLPLKTIAPCPVARGAVRRCVPIFPRSPLEVLKGVEEVSPEPSLVEAEQPQVSQALLRGEALQPVKVFVALLWSRCSRSVWSLSRGLPSCW